MTDYRSLTDIRESDIYVIFLIHMIAGLLLNCVSSVFLLNVGEVYIIIMISINSAASSSSEFLICPLVLSWDTSPFYIIWGFRYPYHRLYWCVQR